MRHYFYATPDHNNIICIHRITKDQYDAARVQHHHIATEDIGLILDMPEERAESNAKPLLKTVRTSIQIDEEHKQLAQKLKEQEQKQ